MRTHTYYEIGDHFAGTIGMHSNSKIQNPVNMKLMNGGNLQMMPSEQQPHSYFAVSHRAATAKTSFGSLTNEHDQRISDMPSGGNKSL